MKSRMELVLDKDIGSYVDAVAARLRRTHRPAFAIRDGTVVSASTACCTFNRKSIIANEAALAEPPVGRHSAALLRRRVAFRLLRTLDVRRRRRGMPARSVGPWRKTYAIAVRASSSR